MIPAFPWLLHLNAISSSSMLGKNNYITVVSATTLEEGAYLAGLVIT